MKASGDSPKEISHNDFCGIKLQSLANAHEQRKSERKIDIKYFIGDVHCYNAELSGSF
jgi:hypothetical protein